MSDTTGREIPAPPRRNAGAATLLRSNRNARVTEPDARPAVGERTVSPPPPRPRQQQPQQVDSPKAEEFVSDVAPATTETRTEEPASATAVTPNAPVIEPALDAEPSQRSGSRTTTDAQPPVFNPSTPYARRRGEASEDLTDDDIVKVTFEIRKGDREAFNAAHAAAKLFEGYPFPKDLIVAIYNAETKRLQDQYNGGQPFPRSGKKAPRGRPIQSDR